MTPEAQLELITGTAVHVETKEELLAKLRLGRPLRVKAGFDPSAPNIHIGHSVPLDILRAFQDLGHTVVLIVGDFTARIGDPSGKIKTRPALTPEEVNDAAETYFAQVGKIIDVEKAEVRGNSEWLDELDFADVLRLASSYTVSRMLERDTFAVRLEREEPISITEMLYPLAQGYDSVAVEADVELGGTDQLFNLLVGRDVQRFYGQEPQVIVTFPLLVGTDGKEKMSSSLGNVVGIAEPPDSMFGKLMSISDESMLHYYELLLKTPAEELAQMKRAMQGGPVNPRDLKLDLAERITARYHSEEAAQAAREEFLRQFSQGELPSDMPTVTVTADELTDGQILLSRLVVKCDRSLSNSQARRLIRQGAVQLDEEKMTDPVATVTPQSGAVLRVGRRRYARIELQ
jgi:tyrosyl-tRNA synthetase